MPAQAPFNVAIVGYGLRYVTTSILANHILTDNHESAKVFHIPLIRALPDVYKLHGIVQREQFLLTSIATTQPLKL